MKFYALVNRLGMLAMVGILLAACAETRFVMHTAKRLGDTNKSQGDYKVGKPYKIRGVWYYPSEDWKYDRTGIASWYGPNFHGKATANGEVFDQWAVSAAHKTLPMPSMVRVTNLENGRSLVVRVNDRGPFVDNRIIDMSQRAAQLLGFDKQGTAKVRVQILANESQILAQRAKAGGTRLASNEAPIQSDSVASAPVAMQDLSVPVAPPVETVPVVEAPVTQSASPSLSGPVLSGPAHVGDLVQVPVSPTRIYIQAGAFSQKTNADKVVARLSAIGGDISVTPISVNGRDLYRVRLGPIADVADADLLLTAVVRAGFGTARTIVENTVVD